MGEHSFVPVESNATSRNDLSSSVGLLVSRSELT